MQGTRSQWLAIALCTGCYQGLDRDAPTQDDAGAGEAGTSEGATSGDSGGDSDTDDPPSACTGDAGKTRLRRLTREQYDNAVTDLVGREGAWSDALEFDERIGPFASNYTAPISSTLLDQYVAASESVAGAVAGDLSWVPCDASDPACAQTLVETLGRRAYRRPLHDDEKQRLLALHDGADTFEAGALLVLRALLQAPSFLYHVEVAEPDVAAVTEHELAARMSFFLWNSIPDDELLDVADAGTLHEPDTLRTQAERMLDDPRARRTLVTFHRQWLGMDELPRLQKDPALFPAFADVRPSMEDELARFVDHVITQDDARLETLLTASYSFVDAPLAAIYGVTLPADHDVEEPFELDPQERAGLLTLPGFLAVHAHANQSAPIRRGVVVRTNVLCNPPPPPPPDADVQPPDPDPDATTRELFEEHTADPTCAACHVYIDGIGLGFEGYDAIGVHRTRENDLPVDERGELLATDVDGEFDGVPELAAKLAGSEDVQACVVRQWFRYSLGRYELDADECALDELDVAFAESDHDIRALVLAIVTSHAFAHKRFTTSEEEGP
jgi:hypothetical protein